MITRLPFLGIGSRQPSLRLFMGSWLYTLLQKSNNNGWKSSIFQTSAGINSSFIAKSPFLFLRLELLVVYQEGLENAVAKDLHVRLDSMLLVCLCYYFSFHLTVYSFSCNSRPLIFWLLRPIGFLKCVSGITEVRDNFRCWSRVVRLHADVYVFWQIFSVSHGVHFLILSFSGVVSAAVSLQTNSKWLYFVSALCLYK